MSWLLHNSEITGFSGIMAIAMLEQYLLYRDNCSCVKQTKGCYRNKHQDHLSSQALVSGGDNTRGKVTGGGKFIPNLKSDNMYLQFSLAGHIKSTVKQG